MVKRKLHGSTEITLATVPRLRCLIRYLLRYNCGYAYSNRTIRATFCFKRFKCIDQRLKAYRTILLKKKKRKDKHGQGYTSLLLRAWACQLFFVQKRRFSAFLWSLVFHTRRIVSIEKFLAHQSTSYPSNNSFTDNFWRFVRETRNFASL